jgi:hypothetical protein
LTDPVTPLQPRKTGDDPLSSGTGSLPLFDEIASLLARQRQLLMDGDADGLRALSEQLGRHLALAAEQRSGSARKADLVQLVDLKTQARINLDMLRRRELSIHESLEALTVTDGRLGSQRNSRVYAAAGTISRSSTSGRSFASA